MLKSSKSWINGGVLLVAVGLTACEVNVEELRQETDAAITEDVLGDIGGPAELTPQEKRGKYLVHHVSLCVDCHTPRTASHEFDETRTLAGVDHFFDFDPTDPDVGGVSAPNLTNHEAGLKNWSDEDIKRSLTSGVHVHSAEHHDGAESDEERRLIHPNMPYWTYVNYTDEDIDAIVAYLRTVPGIDNTPAPHQPLPPPFDRLEARTQPARGIMLDEYPDSTLPASDPDYEAAQKGKYLTVIAGCADCHTAHVPPPEDPTESWTPADVTKLLAGGKKFPRANFGLPTPPVFLYGTNLTPHETGIGHYTAEEIVIALKAGKDYQNRRMCPPMPGGPHSPYDGLTEEDARAIGVYLTTIPPVENEVEDCVPPGD